MRVGHRNVAAVCRAIAVLAMFILGPIAGVAQDTVQTAPSAPLQGQTGLAAATELTVTEEQLKLLVVPMTVQELSQAAHAWQSHMRRELDRAVALEMQLLTAEGTQAKALADQLSARSDEQTNIGLRYRTVLKAWEQKGATPDEVKTHHDYLAALTMEVVDRTDLKTILKYATDWMLHLDGGLGLLLKGLGLLLVLLLVLRLARSARIATSKGLEATTGLSSLLRSFLVTGAFWASVVVGSMIALALAGVNMTPVFAVVGGLGFIVGFALQETLGNLASGLLIIITKPFDRGDCITVGQTMGTVEKMTMIATTLRQPDNHIVIIPNGKIWNNVITNRTAAGTLRVDLVFQVGYSDDTSKAINILTDLVSEHPACLRDPVPQVFVAELGESAIRIYCRPWVKEQDYKRVEWDLTASAKKRFDAAGITTPFPQREVHIHQAPQDSHPSF